MKRPLAGLALSLLLAGVSTGILQAQNPVTFRVDMSVQEAEGKFNPVTDGVQLRGEFNSWAGGTEMLDPDNDKIYEYVWDFPDIDIGKTQKYKFFFYSTGDNWESRSDRSMTVPTGALTLGVAYFNDDSVVSGKVQVTFRVDMSVQETEGKFNPLVDEVQVRGQFNSWSGGSTLTDPDNDKIYEGTFEVTGDPGAQIEYKFFFYGFTGDNWESIDNRRFTLGSGTQTLDVVYFNNDDVAGSPIKGEVHFQVDMNVAITGGLFDPATHEVWVRGNKAGWGSPPEGIMLAEDGGRPGVYVGTHAIDELFTFEKVEYKFVIWKPATYETDWEDISNRSMSFDGTEPDNDSNGYLDKTLDVAYFNNLTPDEVISAETLVTFRVNMSGASRHPGGEPFVPSEEGVWINGDFLGRAWTWSSQPAEFAMHDDGLNGDEVAGDGVYSVQLLFPAGHASMITYKYGILDGDNEAGMGDNHGRYIRSTGTYVMPVDVFGTMGQENLLPELSYTHSGGELTLEWPGAAGLRLQSTSVLGADGWTDVGGTDGASSHTTSTASGNAYFRLYQP